MSGPDRPRTSPRLNESQARALAITLRLVEERLAAIRAILERDERGRLYRRLRPRFTAEQAARIERLMAGLDASIAAAADAFGLQCEDRDANGIMVAMLAMSWQSLGEMDTRGMRAYGDTDPQLDDLLDPAVERMLGLVRELELALAASS
jgi:hypothetical protein